MIIKIEGMSCNHCKMAVERALKVVGGVESVEVDLEKKQAVISGSPKMDDLRAAVEEAGFTVAE